MYVYAPLFRAYFGLLLVVAVSTILTAPIEQAAISTNTFATVVACFRELNAVGTTNTQH